MPLAKAVGTTLLLGVEDWSRHVRGVRDALDEEERLADLISDIVAPQLVPELEILPWRRTQVLAVQVYLSPSRSYCLKRGGRKDGVYPPVGWAVRRADRDLLEELATFARREAFDEQPIPGLDSEALAFRVASEVFAPVRSLSLADLETLRLVTVHQARKLLTVVGCSLSAGTARGTSLTPGARPATSKAPTGTARRTAPRSPIGPKGQIRTYGRESAPSTWRLAKMNLAIRSTEGRVAPSDPPSTVTKANAALTSVLGAFKGAL